MFGLVPRVPRCPLFLLVTAGSGPVGLKQSKRRHIGFRSEGGLPPEVVPPPTPRPGGALFTFNPDAGRVGPSPPRAPSSAPFLVVRRSGKFCIFFFSRNFHIFPSRILFDRLPRSSPRFQDITFIWESGFGMLKLKIGTQIRLIRINIIDDIPKTQWVKVTRPISREL